tara:strand:+ start:76 stop:219 length:144 start_codon:yes stop_codon:yes gene_type:complete
LSVCNVEGVLPCTWDFVSLFSIEHSKMLVKEKCGQIFFFDESKGEVK